MAVEVFAPSAGSVLRQGEIISDYTQLQPDVDRLREGVVELIPTTHPYVIVLSQDCDLEQDHGRRARGALENLLASVLFCAAAPADDDFRHGIGLNSGEWKKVRQNTDPRFHFIRAARAAIDAARIGLPELVVDFKQYFGVPTLEAYYAIETATRRCRLVSPYVEHLSSRFASQFSRVALPLDHHEPLPAIGGEPVVVAAGPAALPVAAAPAVDAPAAGLAREAVVAAIARAGGAAPIAEAVAPQDGAVADLEAERPQLPNEGID